MSKLWGGRFSLKTNAAVQKFTESISYDHKLYAYDIQGSIAHAKGLQKAGILSQPELKAIVKGLEDIKVDIANGKVKFSAEYEDIHMNIEMFLTKRIGAPAKKLHTGRSRNDQVATDMRLYVRDKVQETITAISDLAQSLATLAKDHTETIMPGYTHLQIAQPVVLAHHLLAYVEMLLRDRERFHDQLKRINVMPLGSAALAGTTYDIDRDYVAGLLDFALISENSLDAVSDRDFIVEYEAAAALLMTHVSRMAEEIIIWNTAEYKFIELNDAFATGSSIMPQKKNPDIAELTRGKVGRVVGNLMAMLTTLKGLPLAYNRDLQEDKERLFDTVDTVLLTLTVLKGLWETVNFNTERMYDAALKGYSTATDLADYLAKLGIPFREAHEYTGRLVKYAINQERPLQELTIDEFTAVCPKINNRVYEILRLEASVSARNIYGGTAPTQVKAALKRAFKRITERG